MRLPFGFRIIRESTWQDAERALVKEIKLSTAHRWLAEFDWLLEPFWGWLLKPNYYGDISHARDEMRKRSTK